MRHRGLICGLLSSGAIAMHAPDAVAQLPGSGGLLPGRMDSGAVAAPPLKAYRYRLLGVYDEQTGKPIAGVEVRDMLGGASAMSSSTGTVSLFFLPDSSSWVRLRKIGYDMKSMIVAISPADTTPITAMLSPTAQQLATVNVHASSYHSPRLRAVDERLQSHAFGHFIDEEQMRKLDSYTLTDAIRSNMPGLMTVVGPHGESRLVSSRRMCRTALQCIKPDCYPALYIDGVPSSPRDFDHMSPQDFAIAEFYASPVEAPPEYGGASATCGVLLLWTRER